jgi:hypothetical protein
MLPNRIRQAALGRRRRDNALRPELALRADCLWAVLQSELSAFQVSELGLVGDYIIERLREERANRSLELLKTQQD